MEGCEGYGVGGDVKWLWGARVAPTIRHPSRNMATGGSLSASQPPASQTTQTITSSDIM